MWLLNLKLRKQLMLIFGTLFFIAIITTSWFGTSTTKEGYRSIENDNSLDVAERLLPYIDKDKLSMVIDKGDDVPYYEELRAELDKLRDLTNLEFLYIISKVDGKYVYIVDGKEVNSEDFAEYLQEEGNETNIEKFNEIYSSGETITNHYNTYKEKSMVSSFVPIKDNNGNVLAIIGVDKDISYIEEKITTYEYKMVILVLFLFISMFVLTTIYAKKFTNRLFKVTEAIKNLSNGDVTSEISVSNTKDELGQTSQSVIHLQEMLKTFMDKIMENSYVLEKTGGNLTDIVEKNHEIFKELLKDTDNVDYTVSTQNDNIQLVFRYTNENLEIIKSILNYLQELNTLNEENIASNSNSATMLSNISESLINMDKYVVDSSSKLHHLTTELKKANDILKIIDDISSRTNLLSLNASIESARAGEAGKGFSVVASEIRNLSNNTSEAVVDIGKLLQSLIVLSNETIAEFDKVVESSKANEHIVQNLNAFAEEMKDNNKSYTRILDDVMEVQSTCLENSDMVKNHLDTVTKDSTVILNDVKALNENLAMFSNNVDNISNISKETLDNSKQLKQLVDDFDKTN